VADLDSGVPPGQFHRRFREHPRHFPTTWTVPHNFKKNAFVFVFFPTKLNKNETIV